MSDRINTLPWQPWSLNDLNEPKPVLEPLPQPVEITDGALLDDSKLGRLCRRFGIGCRM